MLRIFEASRIGSQQYRKLLLRNSTQDQEACQVAHTILKKVEQEGWAAVQSYTEKWDGVVLKDFWVKEEEFSQAEQALAPELRQAFDLAADNIRRFHVIQREAVGQDQTANIQGTELGFRYRAVESAAVYVPGGLASYPSSVLMGVIPAKIAGVPDPMIITPPTPQGRVDPGVLYCAQIAGAARILKAGGVQGLAAAAFGLGSEPVSVIVGPGNRYVTAAKSLLAIQGRIRMDLPAGPSEVVVIADETARPDFVAADLLSQAEHGADSPAVLLTCSLQFAQEVDQHIEQGIRQRSSRKSIKAKSIEEHSFALVFREWPAAYDFANAYAPEHLELCVAEPQKALDKITNAGSVFLGHYAPVALGDYCSGTNHILPTGGAARFYSGLGVDTFLKRISYQYPTRESLKRVLEPILLMSRHEGLDQEHGHSVAVRFSGSASS